MGNEGGAMLGLYSTFEVLGHIVSDNQVVGITTEPSYGEYDVRIRIIRRYRQTAITQSPLSMHLTSWPLETNRVR